MYPICISVTSSEYLFSHSMEVLCVVYGQTSHTVHKEYHTQFPELPYAKHLKYHYDAQKSCTRSIIHSTPKVSHTLHKKYLFSIQKEF